LGRGDALRAADFLEGDALAAERLIVGRLAWLFRFATALRAGAAFEVRFSLRAGLAAFFFRPLAFALPPVALRAAPFVALARFPAPLRLEEGVGLCRFVVPLFLAIGVSLLRCQ
jgi:hypothetical protein